MTELEVLAGMPPYGPYPEQFTATSGGTHSEGFVVRVKPEGAESWVGNFQRGLSSYDAALVHPNSRDVILVAGGQAYVVDPQTRQLIGTFGGQICWAHALDERRVLLVHNGLWFEAYGASGLLWRSRRISWDGIRIESVTSTRLTGTAWSYQGRWMPFALELEAGRASGGSYTGPV